MRGIASPPAARRLRLGRFLLCSILIFGPTMTATTPQLRVPAPQISWEQILSNLDDGVITVDLEGKIGFFNEAAEVLTEISSAATTGQRLEQIFKREPWLLGLVGKTQPPRPPSGLSSISTISSSWLCAKGAASSHTRLIAVSI